MIVLRVLALFACVHTIQTEFTKRDMERYREKVRRMFYHAYNGYLEHAYPFDELRPVSCQGVDTWGSFALTLVDALDTLIVMGNATEFKRAVDLVLAAVNPEANVNVSVFETNIRVVGGLLTAHMLSGRVPGMSLDPGWPCSGPLLQLAEKMAHRLLPAFNTDTGMPFGTVNLKYGVHKSETPITCTAGVGTFILEFGALSALTGDPQYEKAALRALEALHATKSSIGLVGNHINVQTGVWTATDAGIGAGVDSYFEYLVKGAILFDRPQLMEQFNEFKKAIDKHVRKGDWFHWVSMTTGGVSLPIFQSLEAFWPGLLTMIGEVEDATRIMLQYSSFLKRYGVPPEFYNVKEQEPVAGRAAYPLRPEMAESLMYLYRASDDPMWLELAAQMVDVIESAAKTQCGYATINKVQEHNVEDRMESFFLAETTKYLYLIFDPHNFLHNDGTRGREIWTPNGHCIIEAGGYIYNTEAHPLDPGIIDCCSSQKEKERDELEKIKKNVKLVSLLEHQKGKFEASRLTKKRARNQYKNQTKKPKKDFDFEVDIKLVRKKQQKLSLAQIMDRTEIKTIIRTARLADEENKRKNAGLSAAVPKHDTTFGDRLAKTLVEIAHEIPEALFAPTIEIDSLVRLIQRRFAAQSIIWPTVLSPNSCYPVEFVGDSVNHRTFLSHIYSNYLYPRRRQHFVLSNLCSAQQTPKEEDAYSNELPDNAHRIFRGDKFSHNEWHHLDGKDESEFEDFSALMARIPGFWSKFVGMGFVLPRNFTRT